MKQLRWLNERIGDTFEGRISGVVNFGIFVELQSSLAEGLIHIDTMEDDDYAYDEDRYCLRGRKTGHEYSMGDKVGVRVLTVLFEKQRANFILKN
jgi:ribonuclease R